MSSKERNVSIEETIKNLLYENECVIIPSFGGFVKQYRPASFDYVQGKISPPSSTITFNENLIIDDGILVEAHKNNNGISLTVAQQQINEFAKKCKQSLSNKEVIAISDVGRIIRDYENSTKFISDNFNFNIDTFGLPELRYYPIHREQINKEQPKTDVIEEKAIPQATSTSSFDYLKWAKIATPIILLLLIAIPIFNWINSTDSIATNADTSETIKKPVTDKKVNESPLEILDENKESIQDDHEMEDHDIQSSQESTVEQEIKKEPKKIQEKTTSTFQDEEYKIIILGQFSKQRGVDIYTAKIVENDWTPYIKKGRKFTTVGIKVYANQNINTILKQARSKIAHDAQIK